MAQLSINAYPYYGMITHHVRESADIIVDQIKEVITSNERSDWYCKPNSFPYGILFETSIYSIDSTYIPNGIGNGSFKVKTEVGYMFCTGFNRRYAPYREIFLPINRWISLRIHDIDLGNQKEVVSFCKRLGKMIKPIMDQYNAIEW